MVREPQDPPYPPVNGFRVTGDSYVEEDDGKRSKSSRYQKLRGPTSLRAPDWRWRTAEDELHTRESATSVSTSDIIRHVSSRLHVETMNFEAVVPELVRSAYEIHAEHGEQRWMLEAWCLTGAPDETIAQALGQAPHLISIYHHLFFDVRDRLEASDWIRSVVHRGRRNDVPPRVAVVQWMAYQAGPEALSAALSALGGTRGLSGLPLPEIDLSSAEGRETARLRLGIELSALPSDGSFRVDELCVLGDENWLPRVPKCEYQANWETVLRLLDDQSRREATREVLKIAINTRRWECFGDIRFNPAA